MNREGCLWTNPHASMIRAVIHDRRIEVPAPSDLPDGTPVVVEVRPEEGRFVPAESEWDDSPTGIVAWLQWLDSLDPLELTSEEIERLSVDRKRQREYELREFMNRADRLASEWK